MLNKYVTVQGEIDLICQNGGFHFLSSEPLKLSRNHPKVLRLKIEVTRKVSIYLENLFLDMRSVSPWMVT